jgi:transcriptional regulator with XRE-family HTH domain
MIGMQSSNLGEDLHRLRLEKGWTLRELGQRVGKSESYLSRLEHGDINPSLGTLKRIADALGRPLVHLLDNNFPPLGTLISKGKHRKLIVSPMLEYEILSAPNHQVTLFKVMLKPGGNSGEPYRHQGVESGIIMKGTVKITVGKKEFRLEEGDTITYSCEEPHSFENVGKDDAIGIWVVSPPSF